MKKQDRVIILFILKGKKKNAPSLCYFVSQTYLIFHLSNNQLENKWQALYIF